MKVVFFGTPQIAADVLADLLQHGVNVVAVITKPDRPKGRSGDPVPTPVKLVAQAQMPPIPVYQPELVSAPDFADVLKSYDADEFVVFAYGEIIKQHLLDMPLQACINLHASLLPKYRGAAPIQRAIINGETETGVTVIHMTKKMDAGDVVQMVKIPIGPSMTAGELEAQIALVGAKLLLDVLQDFEMGIVHRTPQDHDNATLAPKIELEDCEVIWSHPAKVLHNLVRGATPHPGAWCYVKAKGKQMRLKILKTCVVTDKSGVPGTVLGSDKDGVIIACGQQALKLIDVQLEGKKPMPANDLLRGTHLDFKRDKGT